LASGLPEEERGIVFSSTHFLHTINVLPSFLRNWYSTRDKMSLGWRWLFISIWYQCWKRVDVDF